jgi:branched-subunit amino acid transport protein AzlD
MTPYSIVIVLTVALVTFGTRAAPFLLFGRNGEIPPIVQYLGRILPPTIIAVIIIFCIRTIDFTATSLWVPQLVGIGVTAALHIWKRNTLISIAGGTVCYMVMVQGIFG